MRGQFGSRWALVGMIAFGVGCGATSAADKETTLPTAAKVDKKTEQTPEQLFAAAMAEGDEHWQKRDELASLKKAIAAYTKASKIDPKGHKVWVRLSRAYYVLADGFLSFEKDKSDSAMKAFLTKHEEGIVFAKRALLAQSPKLQKLVQSGKKVVDSLSVLDAGAAPALYWFSTNYGKWGVAKGFTTILKYKNMIKKVMDHVLAVAPEFFHGAADRYFGSFYAKAPSFAGGDMSKSKNHFEKSMKAAPYYFGTKVLMAAYWAKKKDDRALFEKLLNEVLKGDASVKAEVAPENRIEQKKAKDLLSKVEDLF
jgi:hypothetical protein